MRPDDTARLLLTVGGRSLWADLEAQETPPEQRRPLPARTQFRDAHCERLLLGVCLAGGKLCTARAYMAGLRKDHFSEPRHRAMWTDLAAWPLTAAGVSERLDLMITYLDAERMANEQQWGAAVHDGTPLPTQSFIACDAAAEGLARRIVMLAHVREKLREAEQLLNGRT